MGDVARLNWIVGHWTQTGARPVSAEDGQFSGEGNVFEKSAKMTGLPGTAGVHPAVPEVLKVTVQAKDHAG